MKFSSFFKFLFVASMLIGLTGCWIRDKAFVRGEFPDSDVHERHHQAHNLSIENNRSYRQMVLAISANGPDRLTGFYREGKFSLSAPKLRKENFKFHYKWLQQNDWTLKLSDREGRTIELSQAGSEKISWVDEKHMSFLIGSKEEVWGKIAQTRPWALALKEAVKTLAFQNFDPMLRWDIEQDGIKTLTITRVDTFSPEPEKIYLYLDKSAKVITREIMSRIDTPIARDIRYTRFQDVDGLFLPNHIQLLDHLNNQSADIYVSRSEKISLSPLAKPEAEFSRL